MQSSFYSLKAYMQQQYIKTPKAVHNKTAAIPAAETLSKFLY